MCHMLAAVGVIATPAPHVPRGMSPANCDVFQNLVSFWLEDMTWNCKKLSKSIYGSKHKILDMTENLQCAFLKPKRCFIETAWQLNNAAPIDRDVHIRKMQHKQLCARFQNGFHNI